MSSQQRLGPPPVDGLSDVAWARVERNVLSRAEGTVTGAVMAREVRRDRSKSSWIWLAVPAAAAAAFGLAFFSMNGSPSSPASDGEPSRVVASDSPTTLSFGDAHITLQAKSAVLMEQNNAKPVALLENGTATFAVAPRGQRPFTVLAGDTSARTMGATFTVIRTGERADVNVTSGTVELRFRGRDIKLSATQSWSSDRPSDVPAAANDAQH